MQVGRSVVHEALDNMLRINPEAALDLVRALVGDVVAPLTLAEMPEAIDRVANDKDLLKRAKELMIAYAESMDEPDSPSEMDHTRYALNKLLIADPDTARSLIGTITGDTSTDNDGMAAAIVLVSETPGMRKMAETWLLNTSRLKERCICAGVL